MNSVAILKGCCDGCMLPSDRAVKYNKKFSLNILLSFLNLKIIDSHVAHRAAIMFPLWLSIMIKLSLKLYG